MTQNATRSGWAAAAFLMPAVVAATVMLALAICLRPLLMTNAGIIVLALFLLLLIGGSIFRSRRDLLAMPVLFSFAYLGYPIGALFYALGWDPPVEDIPTFVRLGENRIYLLLAILLACGGYLALWAGYHLGMRDRKPSEDDIFPKIQGDEILRGRLLLAVLALSLTGLAAVSLIVMQRGGIANYIQTQAASRTTAAGSFYLNEIALFLPLASLLWLGLDFRRAKKSPLFWIIFSLGFGYLLLTSTRWNIIGFLFVVTAIGYQNGVLTKKKSAVLLGILLAIIVVIGKARQISSRGGLINATTMAESMGRNLDARGLLYLTVAGRNFTDIDLLAYILKEYSWTELAWGRTFADIPLMVLPRAFWASKPKEIGVAVFQKYSGWEGVPIAWHPGFLGELYINFHVPGALAGLFVLGLLLAKADRWRLSGPAKSPRQLLYLILGVEFVIKGFVTGFMIPGIQALMYLLPLWVALKIVVRPGQPGRPSRDSAERPA